MLQLAPAFVRTHASFESASRRLRTRSAGCKRSDRRAAIETDLGEENFPGQRPSSFAEAIREGFWPK